MSYILEALKKSQSERELGDVPRIEGFGVDVPMEVPQPRPWAYLGLLAGLLSLAAVALLLLRGLSGMPDEPARAQAGVAPAAPLQEQVDLREPPADPPAPEAAAGAEQGTLEPTGQPDRLTEAAPTAQEVTARRAINPSAPAPTATSQAAPTVSSATIPTAAVPGDMIRPMPASIPSPGIDRQDVSGQAGNQQPQVLVVPAPATPGQPQPRGADELRRAVLGTGDDAISASAAGLSTRPLPSPPPPDQALPQRAPPSSDRAPIPPDLIAEIEAFKELVRKRQPEGNQRASAPPRLPDPPGLAPPKLERAAPATTDTAALPPRPSLDLRNRLPPFSMNVHVYNAEPARRFVYINGRKLTEGQATPDGIRLERVATNGAVLSYDGQEFFQQR